MLETRLIPVLLLRNESLVKTIQFQKFTYVGDPCNTIRIFNELEVDELIVLDITASKNGKKPEEVLLRNMANECFMPLAYGGGIKSLDDAKLIFSIGYEKVVINTAAIERPLLISELAEHFGSQAIIVSIDFKKDWLNRKSVRSCGGTINNKIDPVVWAKEAERLGAGEIFLTSIDREGTWQGFDEELIKKVVENVSIPVIAHGGAGAMSDVRKVVECAGASAVGVGNLVVFQKKGMGVLVNVPREDDL